MHQPPRPPIQPPAPPAGLRKIGAPGALGSGWLDVALLSNRELELVAADATVERLQPVWVRRGLWYPMTLTGWCPLGRGEWAARLQEGPGTDPIWVRHRGASLQPVQPMEQLPPALAALSRSIR